MTGLLRCARKRLMKVGNAPSTTGFSFPQKGVRGKRSWNFASGLSRASSRRFLSHQRKVSSKDMHLSSPALNLKASETSIELAVSGANLAR